MRGNNPEYWNKECDITDQVVEYSKEFVKRFENTDRRFDYSRESIINEISREIDNYSKWDLAQDEPRIYWAQLLAYFSATLCSLFNGKCVGEFYFHNPGPSYYTLRVGLKGEYFNVEDIIGRACDRQFDIASWYIRLEDRLNQKG